MPQPMSGVLIVIASPSDAGEERAAVSDALVNWNILRGRREEVALLPWLWERHAIPKMGDRPQAIINAQAVDQADIVVAFFDSRLGTSTGVDVSGTAEEISRAVELGKHVHVYFSDEPLPRDVDPEQLKALQAFKTQLQAVSILGSYADPTDLSGQVVAAIESDLAESGWTHKPVPSARPSAARLLWQHRYEREQRGLDKTNKMQYRTTTNDLAVTNAGTVTAEDLTFKVTGVGGTQFVFPDPPEGPVTLHPDSSMTWTLIPTPSWGSTGSTVQVAAEWTEGGDAKTGTWTVALHGS